MTDNSINSLMNVKEWLKLNQKLQKDIIAIKIGNNIYDFHSSFPVQAQNEIEMIKITDSEALSILRHSTSHIMADAVQRLFPGTKLTIGPSIEDGFYYDFDRLDGQFTPDDFVKIEQTMKEIINQKIEFEKIVVTRQEAINIFKERGETYKLEIIEDIPEEEKISIYKHGNWMDLCAGPHLPDTGYIKAYKLTSIAGAYWRGDERNKMLTRIYGTAFYDSKSLQEYINRLEEAQKRDHRKLGRELDLYSISEDIGPGLILWHPKGARIRDAIETFWKKAHYDNGYEIVYSPHIGRVKLWEISGHNVFYAQSMYAPMEVEEEAYRVKPMNCPFHIEIYKNDIKSYRDFPIKLAELGTVYRFEKSGQLHGLLRVRGFTQDDAHVFCTQEQLGDEIRKLIKFSMAILKTFGFEQLIVNLSTRPDSDSCVGSKELWDKAESALVDALKELGIEYKIAKGEGAFYGPKIDIEIKDALGRKWQCTTIQVDFNLPERFELFYVGDDGKRDHQPVMIHRALLGSLERFFGILIEHYAGAFPAWLAPVQVKVLNVTERQIAYAEEVANKIKKNGIRVEVNTKNEPLGAKIRDGRLQRIPYLIIIGDKEIESGKISVRKHSEGDLGTKNLDEFIESIKNECSIPSI